MDRLFQVAAYRRLRKAKPLRDLLLGHKRFETKLQAHALPICKFALNDLRQHCLKRVYGYLTAVKILFPFKTIK